MKNPMTRHEICRLGAKSHERGGTFVREVGVTKSKKMGRTRAKPTACK